jgi:hypothetical protein
MTSQPADEDILIDAARAERRQHRSGASMAALVGVAVIFGVIGIALIIIPHLVTVFLPGPLALLGGVGIPVLFTLGIVALAIAGLFLVGALASSPLASWGNSMPGKCPRCGQSRLRSDIVPGSASGSPSDGPRGVVTLCENQECDYATARVTRASSLCLSLRTPVSEDPVSEDPVSGNPVLRVLFRRASPLFPHQPRGSHPHTR